MTGMDIDGPKAAMLAAVSLASAALLAKALRKQQLPQSKSKGDGDSCWESHVPRRHEEEPQEVWPGSLYVIEASGTDHGPPTRNMIIYRPPGSRRLVVFNGIAVREPTLASILELGEPSVLIVPNGFHRCCAAAWKRRFPGIQVVCPQSARDRVAQELAVDSSTEMWAKESEWKEFVSSRTIDGWTDFETVLEVELESPRKDCSKKAMIVCDLLFAVPFDASKATFVEKIMDRAFDCSIRLPADGDDEASVVVPKVARISRLFAIKDWAVAERWYRDYATGPSHIAAICVGHGVPIVSKSDDGCRASLLGVADQLSRPRW